MRIILKRYYGNKRRVDYYWMRLIQFREIVSFFEGCKGQLGLVKFYSTWEIVLLSENPKLPLDN
jgi:hypothetical protein